MLFKMKMFVRQIAYTICYYLFIIIVPVIYNNAYKNGELQYLSASDFAIWKKAMINLLKECCIGRNNFRIRKVMYTFALSKVDVIRKTEAPSKESPIVVLCVKNDLERIKMLVDHYRALGVERFAFLDNGSDDGTFEWLLKQPDIDLYRCFEKYQTKVKEGWMNRIVSYYGFDRWYILTDSDELVVYVGMEEHPIKDVINYARRNRIQRIKGLTIDMYAKGSPFGKTEDIRKEYKWMDVDTYYEEDVVTGQQVHRMFFGGPRQRNMNSKAILSKYPLVYFAKGTISDNAHFQYPHTLLPSSPCYFGILHFKFIDKDLKEYKRRAQNNSGFYNRGELYRKYINYIESGDGASFMYEGSIEYKDSHTLEKIDFIKTMDF